MVASTTAASDSARLEGYAISPVQRHALQRAERADPEYLHCELTACLRVPATPDKEALERLLHDVAQRHDLLCSDYRRLPGMAEPAQIIRSGSHLEVSALPARPTLSLDEPMRLVVQLVDSTSDSVRMKLRLPSFLADVGSLALFAKELAARLNLIDRVHEEPSPRYADVAQLLGELAHDGDAQQYWREVLAGIVDARLPAVGHDHAETDELRYTLREPVNTAVGVASAKHGWAYQEIVLGAFHLLLHRLTERNKLPFALRWDARNAYPELAGVFGPLTFDVPFLLDLGPGTTFTELQRQIRERRQLTDQHALAFPATAPPAHARSRFVFDFSHAQAMSRHEGVSLEVEQADVLDADLVLRWTDVTTGSCVIRFRPDVYSRQDIDLLFDRLQTVLADVCEDPAVDVASVKVMSDREYERIVHTFNSTAREYNARATVVGQFLAQAQAQPDGIAVRTRHTEVSYRELAMQGRRIAAWLSEHGVGRGDLVPLYVDRQPCSIAAMVGVAMAGAAYVPLNTALPPAKISSIVERMSPKVVIACRRWGMSLRLPSAAWSPTLLALDAAWQSAEGTPVAVTTLSELPISDASPDRRPEGDDVAYVIFTSGSTGDPKGVVVRHKRLTNLVDWINRTQAVRDDDCVFLVTAFSFDLSVYDVWGSLAAGATIRLAAEQELADPQYMVDALCSEPITIWNSAPAMLQQLMPLLAHARPRLRDSKLRLAMLSGDWIPVALPGQLRECFPGVGVLAMGGATEATIWSNFHVVEEVDPRWPSIPYGRPMQNCRYYVLDAQRNPQPTGVPGELYIGGVCVADGYFGDPRTTNDRFIADPFVSDAGDRLYRTGDLVRHLGHGELEFLGRVDDQVKIRGHRVEMGEILVALRAHDQIGDAILRAVRQSDGNNVLIAYCLLRDARARLRRSELTAFLAELLPAYAVPTYFVELDQIPVTANGKVDYAALPDYRGTHDLSSAPANDIEARLLTLWRELLAHEQISVTRNFFEMGGHSLTAVRMLARIESELGRRVRMPELVENASIRALATLLASQPEASARGIGCLSRGTQDSPALFCVHPSGGHFLCYQSLARQLGESYTVHGLQAIGFDENETPLESIEQLAASHLAKIRNLQPRGPYHLLGWSLGGVIAFEMARQLIAAGQRVAPLTIIDRSTGFAMADPHRLPRDVLSSFARDLGGLTGRPFLWASAGDDTAPSPAFIAAAVEAGALAADIPDHQVRALFDVFRASTMAMYSYRPHPMICDLTHFVGAQSPTSSEPDWRDFVLGAFDKVELVGDHFSIMREPAALEVVCVHLRGLLDQNS